MPTKKPTLALVGIKRVRTVISFFQRFWQIFQNYRNICVASQIFEIVIFVDISAVSEPILIKQR